MCIRDRVWTARHLTAGRIFGWGWGPSPTLRLLSVTFFSGGGEVAVWVFWSADDVAVVVVVAEVPVPGVDRFAAAPAVDGFACGEASLPSPAGPVVGGAVPAGCLGAPCLVGLACVVGAAACVGECWAAWLVADGSGSAHWWLVSVCGGAGLSRGVSRRWTGGLAGLGGRVVVG